VTVAALTAISSAGAGSSLALAVDPTQLVLVGAAKGTFKVRNPTSKPLPLTASVGNYTIRNNGSFVVNPKLPPRRSAKHWLSISPKRFTIDPHATVVLKVRSHPGRRAGVGDHQALVLFTTEPSGTGKVQVRTRIGSPVLVRVKGKIRRKIAIGSLSVARRQHQLRLVLVNRGNINERLLKHRVSVVLKQGKRTIQSLWPASRDILPRNQSVYKLPYRPSLKGKLTAVVNVRPANGAQAGALAPPLKPIHRTFRIRL